MRPLLIIIAFVSIVVLGHSDQAYAADTFQFDDEVTQKRYQSLIKELRCPKCQNQNLADSNAPIAKDLRRETYELLEMGKTDGEIVNFMVERYGDFVLYRPKVSKLTYVLWFGPGVLLVIGIAIAVIVSRQRSKNKKNIALNAEQKAKLNELLKDK